MKKLTILAIALVALCACNNKENATFMYRGLAFSMPVTQFVDSMKGRGFAVDSAASDSGRTVVMTHPVERYHVLAAFKGDTLLTIQENYLLTTNDSTRNQWQQLRDNLEKELGSWPDCPMLKDDHKIVNFETEGGFISVILENTYTPTLAVQYKVKR